MKRRLAGLPLLLFAALSWAQVRDIPAPEGAPLADAPALTESLPVPALDFSLPAAPPPADASSSLRERLLDRMAAYHGVDRPTLDRAVGRLEDELGIPVERLGSPRQMERQLSSPSFRTRYVEPERLAEKDPGSALFALAISQAASDFGFSIEEVRAEAQKAGLASMTSNPASFEDQLRLRLLKRELARLSAGWPDNAQARFMKNLMRDLTAKSGESVEEIARAGAFAYVTMAGQAVLEARSGRDPDVQSGSVFYVTYEKGRFRFGPYGPQSGAGSLAAFRRWLQMGLPDLRLD